MSGRPNRPGDTPLFAWGNALRAANLRRAKRNRRLAATGAGAVLLLATAVFPPAPRLMWNVTASAPLGLYRVIPGDAVVAGDIVAARMPERFRLLAAERRYLPLGVPLVKPVAAIPGDEVCALDREIFVNGRPAAVRRDRDGHGRIMPIWTGCIRLRGRQLFLLSGNPDSFDGRYLGVVEGQDVIGKAVLLWRR